MTIKNPFLDKNMAYKINKRLNLRKENVVNKSVMRAEDINIYAKLSKIDAEKRMAYGIATSDDLDRQEEVVEWEGTKRAIPEYKKWRNLREMHKEDSAVGTVPLITLDEKNKQVIIGAHVVDDKAWGKVKSGVYKGFSIGGKALSRIKEFNAKLGKNISRVKDYMMTEISLVDRPALPTAEFLLVKRDSNLIDPLALDVHLMKNKTKNLEDKIVSDEDISKAYNKDFGLVKRFKHDNGDITIERYFYMPDVVHAKAVLKQLIHSDLDMEDKKKIHKRAEKILGKLHNEKNCEFCSILNVERDNNENENGGGDKQMNKSGKKLQAAKKIIDELIEGEGMEEATDEILEENLTPAEQIDERKDEEEIFEGDEDEDDEDEDDEDIDEEDEGDDIDEQLDEVIFETEEDKDKKVLDEGDNEAEGEKVCSYCGTTLKSLMSGSVKKKDGSIATQAPCPACKTVWSLNKNQIIEVKPTGKKIVKSMDRLRNSGGDDIQKVLIDNNNKLVKIIKKLGGRIEALENVPADRKEKVLLRKGGDEDSEEIEKFDADVEKAKNLRKMANETGKPLSAEDDAFCKNVLKKMLTNKYKKG